MLHSTRIRLGFAIVFIIYGRSYRLGSQTWCDVICFHRRHAALYPLRTSQHGNIEECIGTLHTGHWSLNVGNRLKLNPGNTELLSTGKRHSLSKLTDGGPRLVLDSEVINASSSACLLGMTFRQICIRKSTHPSPVEGIFSSYAS